MAADYLPETYTPPACYRGDSWPGLGEFQIAFESGEPFAALADATADTLAAEDHGLTDGDIFSVAATAGGLTLGTSAIYHAVNVVGDTWQAATEADGDAVDLTGNITHQIQRYAPPATALAHVRIQFRLGSETGSVGLELSDGNEKITIIDADEWIIDVPAQAGPSKAGEWYWDLETEDAAGVIRTYVTGVQVMQQDTTRIVAAE